MEDGNSTTENNDKNKKPLFTFKKFKRKQTVRRQKSESGKKVKGAFRDDFRTERLGLG